MGLKKATPPGEYASDADVIDAIRALTDADRIRLSRVAEYRARALVGLHLGLSADDLLQEAIRRTLNGERRWRKTVSFRKHLIETIRSLANHAPDELKGCAVTALEDSGVALDGVSIRSTIGNGERVAAANEQLLKIRMTFEADDEVSLVLEDLASGMTGPEIQKDLGITQTQFETIVTRLRRGINRKDGWLP